MTRKELVEELMKYPEDTIVAYYDDDIYVTFDVKGVIKDWVRENQILIII